MPKTIGGLTTSLTAAQIADNDDALLAVEHLSTSKKMTLTELRRAAVDVVNVRDYGAVGDGVTDDTAAIVAAIAAVPEMTLIEGQEPTGRPVGGVEIRFPTGTYLISESIVLPDEKNLYLRGDGFGSAVIYSGGDTPPDYAFDVEADSNTQSAVELFGLTFHNCGVKVGTNRRRFGAIRDCQFIGAPVWAITFANGCVEWTVEKCAISEGAGGVCLEDGLNTDLIRLRNLAFIRNDGVDLWINNSQAYVESCDFEVRTDGNEDTPWVHLGPNVVDTVFTRCRFGNETPPNTVIRTGTAVGSSAAANVKFLGCSFNGGVTNCFLLNLPPKNWTVTDCTFRNNITTIFNEAFATSSANTANATDNYLDAVMFDTGVATTTFSASGVGWKVGPRMLPRMPGNQHSDASTNLVKGSGDLASSTSWVRQNTSPVRNATGPDGATSAYTVAATSDGSCFLYGTGISASTPVTASVWLKAGTISKARIGLYDGTYWETGQHNHCQLTSEWKQYSVTSWRNSSRTLQFFILLGSSADSIVASDSILVAMPEVVAGTTPRASLDARREKNVRDYGAFGDGITDDTSAIQAAIDAVGTDGKLVFPDGSYAVSATLKVNRGIVLEGFARGHEGNVTGGAALKWVGSEDGVIMRVNDGTSGDTVHGWTIRNLSFNGNSVSGVTGLVLGAGNDGTPRAAVGTLENLWFASCAIGLDCWTAQLCTFINLHAYLCDTGMKFSGGTNRDNTAINVIGCRCRAGDVGIHIQNLRGSVFHQCTMETNADQGLLIENGPTDYECFSVLFDELWLENNLTGGGTGRGQIDCSTSNASLRNLQVVFRQPKFGVTPDNNYDMRLHGGDYVVDWPYWDNGMEIHGGSVAATTALTGRWYKDPASFLTVTAGTGSLVGTVEYTWSTSSRQSVYIIKLNKLVKYLQYTSEGVEGANDGGDDTNKSYRWCTFHFDEQQASLLNMMGTCVSGTNLVYLGGGSSVYNAATQIKLYAAANSTTLTGTEQMRIANNAIHMYTLPTSDPHSVGQLWNNSGVLTISAG